MISVRAGGATGTGVKTSVKGRKPLTRCGDDTCQEGTCHLAREFVNDRFVTGPRAGFDVQQSSWTGHLQLLFVGGLAKVADNLPDGRRERQKCYGRHERREQQPAARSQTYASGGSHGNSPDDHSLDKSASKVHFQSSSLSLARGATRIASVCFPNTQDEFFNPVLKE